MRKPPKLSSEHAIAMLRFQRYLTRHYPITSAMSNQIGNYVLTNLLAPQKIKRMACGGNRALNAS